jgi:hypothetical protein
VPRTQHLGCILPMKRACEQQYLHGARVACYTHFLSWVTPTRYGMDTPVLSNAILSHRGINTVNLKKLLRFGTLPRSFHFTVNCQQICSTQSLFWRQVLLPRQA